MENSFPIGVIPEPLRSIIMEVSSERQYALDYLAASVLWVISVVVGACAYLQVFFGKIYANQYLILIGTQGGIKTHPLKWATQYLRYLNEISLQNHDREYYEYESAINRHERLPMPVAKRYLLDTSTPEAIVKRLCENPKGIGLCCNEISKGFKELGRYNKNSDDELLIHLYDGDAIAVDRVSRPNPLHAASTYFCMAGTTQLKTFRRIFSTDRVESGLMARFLVVAHYEDEAHLWDFFGDMPGDAEQRYVYFLDRDCRKLMNIL